MVTCFTAVAHLPRFTLVTYFPALHTGYIFSRDSHWLHVFSRSTLGMCFFLVGGGGRGSLDTGTKIA